MKITEITVHAGRTFNHPFEQYANFKPGLSLRATLSEEDDVEQATKALQLIAEQLAEGQKQQILADLRQLERQARITSSIAATERHIEKLHAELAMLKRDAAAPRHASQKLETKKCEDCGHDLWGHTDDGCSGCSCPNVF
jgi:hypothetical protein